MYELYKIWCADTLLSNSVICAIGVLQHDKQKCWSPKCISLVLLEPRPLSICAELNKQGALDRHIFPSIPTSVAPLHVKQPSNFFSIFCNLELICISYNYDAATDVGMLGKMCRSSAPCLCTLLTSVPSCLCAL